jgi:flagellar biosynthetic protein FlhB
MALVTQQTAYYLKCAGERTALLDGDIGRLGADFLWILLKILIPYLAVNFIFALLIQFVQHGFKPTFKPLQPKFSKLNPINGFKRIFSIKSTVELLKGIIKLIIIHWVAYLVIAPKMPTILQSLWTSLDQGVALFQTTLFQLYRNVLIAMIIVAAIDYLYQKYHFEKTLRMTKQEVKDEHKDAEGNPEIKGKQRSMMMQAAMRRIVTQVPKASVVITNPTHYAVALLYGAETPAPVCVAKGVDHMALKIKERANVTGIPIIENPPLARLLYRTADIDKPIPPDLYHAVAQVLAYVYKLKNGAA